MLSYPNFDALARLVRISPAHFHFGPGRSGDFALPSHRHRSQTCSCRTQLRCDKSKHRQTHRRHLPLLYHSGCNRYDINWQTGPSCAMALDYSACPHSGQMRKISSPRCGYYIILHINIQVPADPSYTLFLIHPPLYHPNLSRLPRERLGFYVAP